jgi:hypothetical protein
MNKPTQTSFPAIIEPDYDYGPLRKRFKKVCSRRIHQSKHSPIPCPPSGVLDGLQHPAKLECSMPHTIYIVHERIPSVKDCIVETESSSSNVLPFKRKRASTSPNNTIQQLVKPRLLCAPGPDIPSCSKSSMLPLGTGPLSVAPSLPRLAAGRTIPMLSLR